jgi:hypothetical protein
LPSIIDLLIKIQLIDERQHEAVLSRARSPSGGHIVQEIAELGYATEGAVARAISVELGLPRIDLSMTPPENAALALLDARTCKDRFVLPVALRENDELLWLAMADPTDQEALGIVRRKSQKRIRPAVAAPSEILLAIRSLYPAGAGPAAAPTEREPHEKLAGLEASGSTPVTPAGPGDAPASASNPLSRIAQELGVEVPETLPSQRAPGTGPLRFEQLFTPDTQPGPIELDDLGEEQLATLDALRSSLEKGALVLRSLAELCVEKSVFTREEMKKRKPPTGPVTPS